MTQFLNRLVSKIRDALRDLVAFVQFKKRGKHPWRSVKINTSPWVLLTFLKLDKQYQIVQRITYGCWKLVQIKKNVYSPRSTWRFLGFTWPRLIIWSNVFWLNHFAVTHRKVFWISFTLSFSCKGAKTAGTCPINNSNQNPFVFPPSCQE